MDIRKFFSEFVTQARDLGTRLRSPDKEMVTTADLDELRTLIYRLDLEAINLQNRLQLTKPPSQDQPTG